MKKNTTPTASPWTDADITPEDIAAPLQAPPQEPEPLVPAQPAPVEYDMEGLMTDFPTATELERFVYDQTGVVLTLKGRANRVKYQVAMDVLNGEPVAAEFIGATNPYVDRTEMVPEDPIPEPPQRDARIPAPHLRQNSFFTRMIPHPDSEERARGRNVHTVFRKYQDGTITYEVLGPVNQRAIGEKIDKYGRTRPELITWIDPRTGEQIVQFADGTLTDQGRRLRAMMQTLKVNRSNQWAVWVDRDFIANTDELINNPWV